MGREAGRFLVIEGNNGAGKSAIATEISSRTGCTYLHFPPEFGTFRDQVRLDASVGAEARLAYYLGATLHLAELVDAARRMGMVVCDRYLAAPLSLLIADGMLPEQQILELSGPFERFLPFPDLTVLLTVRYQKAVERIQERRSSDRAHTPVEERILSSRDFFLRREAALRRQSIRLGPVVEIDTTDRGLDETVLKVEALLADAALGR